jgi:hypothetical protein
MTVGTIPPQQEGLASFNNGEEGKLEGLLRTSRKRPFSNPGASCTAEWRPKGVRKEWAKPVWDWNSRTRKPSNRLKAQPLGVGRIWARHGTARPTDQSVPGLEGPTRTLGGPGLSQPVPDGGPTEKSEEWGQGFPCSVGRGMAAEKKNRNSLRPNWRRQHHC